jgi:peptidoglycan/LPS O-acetylase OafA/YrhL
VSYAFYLIQLTEPIQWLFWVGLGEKLGVENMVWRAVLLYVLSTGIAGILYAIVEKPANRWLKSLSAPRVN